MENAPDRTPGLLGRAENRKSASRDPNGAALMTRRSPVSPCAQLYNPSHVPVSTATAEGDEAVVGRVEVVVAGCEASVGGGLTEGSDTVWLAAVGVAAGAGLGDVGDRAG